LPVLAKKEPTAKVEAAAPPAAPKTNTPITLQQCVMAAFPSCVRKFNNDADAVEIADRAADLGKALYKKLQSL